MSFSVAQMTLGTSTELHPTASGEAAEAPLTPDYFFYLLFQAARQRDLFCDRLFKPIGLNVAQWRCLAIIRRLEACTMTQLARYSTVERTTLTRAVDQLVSRGFVVRAVAERDRRKVILVLTDTGEAIYRQAVAMLASGNQAVIGQIDLSRLRDAVQVLGTALEGLVGSSGAAADLLDFGRFALAPKG